MYAFRGGVDSEGVLDTHKIYRQIAFLVSNFQSVPFKMSIIIY